VNASLNLSVFDVSIELATVTRTPVPLYGPHLEPDAVMQGTFFSTSIGELVDKIQADTRPYYLLVDIGDGRRWLISRLLLFTFVLWRIGAVRCVVVVETSGAYTKRLLGIALPQMVCAALGRQYPWFDKALVTAWSAENCPLLAEPLAKENAVSLVDRFMALDEIIRRSSVPTKPDEWESFTRLGAINWEHTKWLDSDRVNEILRPIFLARHESCLVDSPDTEPEKRNRALLSRHSPFIALVNDQGEITHLVDRQALLERFAEALKKQQPGGQ
jgi:hypothetical protein